MKLTDSDKIVFAKIFTELAIQNGLIQQRANSQLTATEVTNFFHTVCETLDKKENK